MSPPILDPIRGALLRSQPDGRLVALAREGRERAIEEIVRRYRAPLVAFAAMIVPAHRADDVVQDSLLRAIDALGSSEAEIQLRPWLFRIVRNQALNDLRDTPTHDELGAELDGVASPDEIAERREEIAALVGGLRALPDAQREAIVARELEGRGHSEIAAELGTSPGAVRQLIFRARSTLRGAAGLLVPLPLLRVLLGPGNAEAAGEATTAGVAVAATAGAGAATGAAGKVAVGLAGVAVAVGGGIAAERSRDGGDGVASANGAEERAGGGGAGSTAGGLDGGGYGAGRARSVWGPRDTGGSSHGGSGSSGSGGGERSGHGGRDDSGSGSDQGEGTGDSSGSGSSESSGGGSGSSGSGSSGSGSSGSGSGEDVHEGDLDEDEVASEDVDGEPETSGSSGSGSSGSGSSGSGSSGSGSSGSSDQLDPNDLD